MDPFLDNMLDTFRILTFQRMPLDPERQGVNPEEELLASAVTANEPAHGAVQAAKQVAERVRKRLRFLFMPRF